MAKGDDVSQYIHRYLIIIIAAFLPFLLEANKKQTRETDIENEILFDSVHQSILLFRQTYSQS